MNLKDDTAAGILRSMGTELDGFADVFSEAGLDMAVILGDRYEIQMAAVATMIFQIPTAHLYGGELTEGAIDDAIRHSITKMSELHFTSTKEYANRVVQMGEQPERVFYVGALGSENAKKLDLYDRDILSEKFGAAFLKPYVMVTYHPVTLEAHTAKGQFEALLKVIGNHPEYNYIFTYANADPDGLVINRMIEEYVKSHDNTIAFISMGQMGYLSALKYCEFVLGNSSSGLVEAPSFHIPTINIGNRQQGRARADSVIDCGYSEEEIESAFSMAKDRDFLEKCRQCNNPYEGKDVAKTIVTKIKEFLNNYTGKKKKFYDLTLS
jgi:GDP/UDP-N,N'-diacetylbacillosamine 2-epimerase (hydrolysing)